MARPDAWRKDNEHLFGRDGSFAEPGLHPSCPQCGGTFTEVTTTEAHRTRFGANYLPGKKYQAIWCHGCDTQTITGKAPRNGPEVG